MVRELPTFQAGDMSARRMAAVPALRCLVVDGHPAIRLGLSELLAAEADIEVLECGGERRGGGSPDGRRRPSTAIAPTSSGSWGCTIGSS